MIIGHTTKACNKYIHLPPLPPPLLSLVLRVQFEVIYPFGVAVTAETLPEEISAHLLDGVGAVHLDSRHTEAAIALAKLANERLEQASLVDILFHEFSVIFAPVHSVP